MSEMNEQPKVEAEAAATLEQTTFHSTGSPS